jgi:methionyl-tRNA formyltransferase
MIKNNNFFIDNLKTVVFLGQSNVFSKLIEINKSLKLNNLIITSSDQSKIIDKKINYKVFDKLDNKFKYYINKNIKVKNTIFVSLGARYIFTKDTIENLFLNNLVNFHGTRLPLDSGAGGYSWKIMREDRIDNQLVHVVDEGLDTGPILDNHLSLFPKQCQIPVDFEVYRLNKFIEFYKNFIKQIQTGEYLELKPQHNYLGRYNPRLYTEIDGLINWDFDSYDLFNFINAFDEPYKGASTFLNNGNFGKLYLKKVHLHGGDSSNHPYMSGIVSRHDVNWIVVSTKSKHMLLIEEVLDKKGFNIIKNIKVGDRFFTPTEELDRSKKTRRIINSKGLKKLS